MVALFVFRERFATDGFWDNVFVSGCGESVLGEDLAGVLATDRRRPVDGAGRVREVDRRAEVLEAADLRMVLLHDVAVLDHLGVVVHAAGPVAEVLGCDLARHACVVECLPRGFGGSSREPGLDLRFERGASGGAAFGGELRHVDRVGERGPVVVGDEREADPSVACGGVDVASSRQPDTSTHARASRRVCFRLSTRPIESIGRMTNASATSVP